MTVLLVAIVVVALLMAAGSRVNQSRLGGRNVRAHRRALGRLATITAEQPDRVEADVSQAHLHVRLVDEDPVAGPDRLMLDLRDRPGGGVTPGGAAPVGPWSPLPPPPLPHPPVSLPPADADHEPGAPLVPGGTTLAGLEDRMAAMNETEIEVTALPTGAVTALTRFGPAELRSRRQRRRAGKTSRRR